MDTAPRKRLIEVLYLGYGPLLLGLVGSLVVLGGKFSAVAIDGELADCCAGRGPDGAALRAAGLGQALA